MKLLHKTDILSFYLAAFSILLGVLLDDLTPYFVSYREGFYHVVIGVFFLISQTLALGFGIAGRRTLLGKAGIYISVLSLLCSLVFVFKILPLIRQS